MIHLKRYVILNQDEINALANFLKENEDRVSPYDSVGFINIVDEVFGYENFSLVAVDDQGRICGYLFQWRKGRILESVPWRDRGGPVYLDEEVLKYFIEETKGIVKSLKLRGFIWKNFLTGLLKNYRYFINVKIDLTEYDVDGYWNKLAFQVRGKIRNAQRNGLVFQLVDHDIASAIKSFYSLFVSNRKRLGVPVYPIKLFESYFKNIPASKVKIFNVCKDGVVVSSCILLNNSQTAIDAYSASSDAGIKLKANDMLMYNILIFCMKSGIKYFDFGADSPSQQSLIDYKLKWLGKEEQVITSFWGNVGETDHNRPLYGPIKSLIRVMPMPLYLLFSKVLIK